MFSRMHLALYLRQFFFFIIYILLSSYVIHIDDAT